MGNITKRVEDKVERVVNDREERISFVGKCVEYWGFLVHPAQMVTVLWALFWMVVIVAAFPGILLMPALVYWLGSVIVVGIFVGWCVKAYKEYTESENK